MSRKSYFLVLLALLGVLTLACTGTEKATTVSVTGSDFAFEAPDTVEAGLVTWQFTNTGQQPHHLQVTRLEQGKTPADLQQFLSQPPGPDNPFPDWLVFVGGVGLIEPGDAGSVTAPLSSGSYFLLCFFPDLADGVPHFAKGMMKPLQVTGDVGQPKPSQAAATINLKDFAFEMPPA